MQGFVGHYCWEFAFFCGGSTEKPVEGEVGSSSHFKEEPGCCMNGCPGGDVCIRKDSDEGTCSQDCWIQLDSLGHHFQKL